MGLGVGGYTQHAAFLPRRRSPRRRFQDLSSGKVRRAHISRPDPQLQVIPRVKAAPEEDEVHGQPAALAACLGRPGPHGPLPAEPVARSGPVHPGVRHYDDPRTVVAAPSPADSQPSRSFSPLTEWAHSHAAGAATSCLARFRHWLGHDRPAILATAWPPRRSAGRARPQPQPNDTRPDCGRYWPAGLPRPPPASPAPGLTEPTAERLAERADAADTRWLDTRTAGHPMA